LKRKNLIRKPNNFYEWVLKYFGKGIGKHFLFPYNTKILSYDIKQINPSWTGRFVPSTSLNAMINGALHQQKSNAGYNSLFYYPEKNGIQFLPNALVKKLKNKIHTNHRAQKIDIKKQIITFENGHSESYETLITTAPLNRFLGMIKESSKTTFKRSIPHLLCNSVINFNIGINKPNITDKHWIYFPEKKYAFYRLGFWSSFSQNMAPKGCSSIYGEISYLPETKTKKQLENAKVKAISQTLHILGLSKDNVVTEKVLHLDHAYVIYNAWRQKNLNKLHRELNNNNIYSIGRFGEWKYSSMQEAVLDGKNIANKTLSKKIFKFNGARKIFPLIHHKKNVENEL
jgi:protoporphyrinogen oxidase